MQENSKMGKNNITAKPVKKENVMRDSHFDVEAIRRDFPILNEKVNGKPLVYFDNAATGQKPKQVIQAIDNYYKTYNANVHRGVHHLSQVATIAMEEVRKKVKKHLNARDISEIIFTQGTTDSINLVAQTWGRQNIEAGDEILISYLEHHSNIVPWQMLVEEKGATLKVLPISQAGEWEMEELDKLLTSKTKLVAISHVSNTLGTINPIEKIIEKAHEMGAKVLIDGAQATPHLEVDVEALNCDFYAFSGHKVYGPTGIGILYGKKELLEEMPPWRGGGEMIKRVTFEKTEYNTSPHKFEAGTPHIAGIIGLGAALDYLNEIGLDHIARYENTLLEYAREKMATLPGIKFYGTSKHKAAVISFLIEGTHPLDIGTIIDKLGVAVRTGHHCTEPLMDFYEIPGTIRASFSFYNTKEEIDVMVAAIKRATNMLL